MEDSWMGLNQFLHDVGNELQEILWNEVLREPPGRKLERLKRELERESVALTELRTTAAELRRLLAEQECHARGLEARVRVYLHVADRTNAWRHALELDRLRHTLDQDRGRFHKIREACQAQRARVRQLEEQLDTFLFEKYPKG
jgi:hypothetical protein